MRGLSTITVKYRCDNIAERWRHQYPEGCEERFDKIYQELLKCDKKKETIEKIIGNRSWTELLCSICGKTVDKLGIIDGCRDDYHHESACINCLKELIKMIEEAE
jgi:hypothetical protein